MLNQGNSKKPKNYNPGFYTSNPVIVNIPPAKSGDKNVSLNITFTSTIKVAPKVDPREPESELQPGESPGEPEPSRVQSLSTISEKTEPPSQNNAQQAQAPQSNCCWPFSLCC